MKPKPLKGRTWNPYSIPGIIDPGGVRCIKVYIPDSLEWLQIFAAVMDTMCHWKNYELLGDTSAAQCAALMRSIMQQYNTFKECDDCQQTIVDEMEYLMAICEQLRFQNGVLQGLCCGEWIDIAGQAAQGIGGPGQPGGGGATPTTGECTTYHAAFGANSQWLLPFAVSAGDTLTFTNAKGAGTDGGISGIWNCPNGQTFFAGGCVGFAGPKAGDVAPLLDHMQLVANIGGTWYPCNTGTISVPGGISNEQVLIQCNDSSIADNSGDYTLDVEACNNQLGNYTHTFNFALNTGGFVTENFPAYTPQYTGAWAAASGWLSSGAAAAGQTLHAIQIQRILAAPHVINTAELTYDLTKGTVNPGLTNGLFLQLGLTSVVSATRPSNTDPDGTALTFVITPGSYTVDSIYVEIKDGWSASPGAPGSSRAYQLVVTGPGSDPW